MLLTNNSTFFCPSRIHMGVGSYQVIAEVIRKHECKRIFIALDAALHDTEFYSAIKNLLTAEGVTFQAFTDIEPDPSANTVGKAFDAYRAHEATLLLAIGGGSTMDVAKAVSILATNGGRIQDYEGNEKFSIPPIPLIAIPTTAGTGSEVSISCVITDTDRNLKMSIRHEAFNPATIAILDPLALRTVPAHVAAHSGIDAFVHAFESFVSRKANLITEAISLQAIELIAGNIRPFFASRENMQAGLSMLCGSTLAGIAFSQTGTGNVHCMARFVGARFHLPHGLSNAICLPHVARFNLLANPQKFARVAAAMGRSVTGVPLLDAAEMAVRAIEGLCQDLEIPARLSDAGVTADSLDDMAEQCVKANFNQWNPRYTTKADFRALFQRAY